jgi:hypothetical protein
MFNLVESIQKNLGYAKLYKVDPNTQDIDEKEKSFGNNSLAQAGIPAVLCGLFNYILRPEGDSLTLLPENAKWLTRIADYAGTSIDSARGELEHMADEAVRLLKENTIVKNGMNTLREFSVEHKNDPLYYLPGALRTGEILGNSTLDDHTHKMDGPISGLMHSIEKYFNGDEKIGDEKI